MEVAIVFLMLGVSILATLLLIIQSRKNRVLEKVTERVKEALSTVHTENRLYEEEQLQRLQGNRDKKKFLYRMDEMLLQSGIRNKMPFMTTELFLTMIIVVAVIVFYFVSTITREFIFAVLAVIFVVMMVYGALKFLLFANKSKLDDDILQFANMLENYSRTTDDIVSILGQVYVYLNDPLKTVVRECYTEMKSTGDIPSAFARLSAKIGNRKFEELLQNIEMCSRHETNYEAVIAGNKVIIKDYLAEKEISKQMALSARLEICVLFVIAVYVVSMINDMLEDKLMAYLMSDFIGKTILLACACIALFSVWKIITMGQEDDY